jgi:hypothetical protein
LRSLIFIVVLLSEGEIAGFSPVRKALCGFDAQPAKKFRPALFFPAFCAAPKSRACFFRERAKTF